MMTGLRKIMCTVGPLANTALQLDDEIANRFSGHNDALKAIAVWTSLRRLTSGFAERKRVRNECDELPPPRVAFVEQREG
jgi:hypothetical protein